MSARVHWVAGCGDSEVAQDHFARTTMIEDLYEKFLALHDHAPAIVIFMVEPGTEQKFIKESADG